MCLVFLFKQKTAYEMRISDWSSDVCSSDLHAVVVLDELLVVAADTLVLGQRGRDLVAEVAHAGDLHVGLAHGAGAAGEVLVQRRWLWHLHVLERLGEARRRLPAAVRRLEPIGRAACRERVWTYV